MEEIWKTFKEVTSKKRGYRLYEVSNFGNVKINGEFYECKINKDGYKRLSCYNLHSIVAELFIGPRPYKYDVDHIDNNRLNNNVSNLRYISHKDNINKSLTRQNHIGKHVHKGSLNPMYGRHWYLDKNTCKRVYY